MPARRSAPPRPFLIELVGLPGSGKSTVFEALSRRSDRIGSGPVLSRRPHVALLAREMAAVLATLVRRRALGRQWTRELLVMAAYLGALASLLGGAWRPDRDAIVFDQGPIFALTRPALLDERLAEWWDSSFATWRSLLDVVVWLEAPDEVLIDRIGARGKFHRLKGGPDEAALDVLAQDQAVYDFALDKLQVGDRTPTILRFDTSRLPAEAIVDELLTVIPAP